MGNRREFLRLAGCILATVLAGGFRHDDAPRLAVTMDDPHTGDFPLLGNARAIDRIISALAARRHSIALFVTGRRVADAAGSALLRRFSDAGHLICNHSWSHLNFHDASVTLQSYAEDMRRCDALIRPYPTFTPLFRYPLLREGDTAGKRDGMRAHLRSMGYRNGAATIDTSDWYIEVLLNRALAQNPRLDTTPARDFYIEHMVHQAEFYRATARTVLGRDCAHTLLVHFNQLNALFLGDLLDAFVRAGWQLTPAATVFADPVFAEAPNVLPAGNSLIKGLARQAGLRGEILDPPGENEELIARAFSALHR